MIVIPLQRPTALLAPLHTCIHTYIHTDPFFFVISWRCRWRWSPLLDPIPMARPCCLRRRERRPPAFWPRLCAETAGRGFPREGRRTLRRFQRERSACPTPARSGEPSRTCSPLRQECMWWHSPCRGRATQCILFTEVGW